MFVVSASLSGVIYTRLLVDIQNRQRHRPRDAEMKNDISSTGTKQQYQAA